MLKATCNICAMKCDVMTSTVIDFPIDTLSPTLLMAEEGKAVPGCKANVKLRQ